MELAALPSEVATVPKGMSIFMEPREDAIRMFDRIPAHWARNGGAEVLSLSAEALVGEYFTFQAGVFANGPALRNCPGPPGRSSALSVFLCKSVFYGAFVWTRRVLNSQKRRFPARAVNVAFSPLAAVRTTAGSAGRAAAAAIPASAMTCFNVGGK
jgi:hypothetical protein